MKKLILFSYLFCTTAFGWTIVGQGLKGWSTNPLSLYVDTTNCTISDEDFFTHIDAAIALWNSVPTANLNLQRASTTVSVADFTAGSATEVPVILCDPNLSTTLGHSADSTPGVTTNITFSPNITYSGVLMNAEGGSASNMANLSDVFLQVTIAHELGHALGLGHTSVEESMMYFSISNKTELFLTQDDRDGLSYLYPSNFGCAAVRRPTNSPSRPFWYAAFLLFILFAPRVVGRKFLS